MPYSIVLDLENSINTKRVALIEETEIKELDIDKQAIMNLEKTYEKKSTDFNQSLIKANKKEKDLALNNEKIRSEESKLAIKENNYFENKKHFDDEISSYIQTIPELDSKIEYWDEKLPIIKESNKSKISEIKKQLKELEKIGNEIANNNIRMTNLQESSNKYNGRIVKKRLNLSEELGDNWKEKVEEYEKIDFTTNLQEIRKEIENINKEKTTQDRMLSEVETNLRRTKNDLLHLKELKGEETCPTCKQGLSEEALEKLITQLKIEKDSFCEEKKRVTQLLDEINNKLSTIKSKELDLDQKNSLFDKVKSILDDLPELENEKEIVDKEYDKLDKQTQKLKKKFSQDKMEELEIEKELLEDKSRNISNALKELPKLVKIKEKNKLLNDEINKSREMVQKLKQKYGSLTIESIQEEIDNIQTEIKKCNNILDIIGDIKLFFGQKDDKEITIKEINEEIIQLESNEDFKNQNEITNQWNELNTSIISMNTTVQNIQEEILPPLIKQKNQLMQKNQQLKKTVKDLTLENKKREICVILRSIMRELPNRLLPNYITTINKTSTEILRTIAPESDIQGIVVNDDYSIDVIRLGNFEDISILSGGETIIVALALRLAFAKEFSSLDLLILDEPTIFLDDKRRNELVYLLEKNRLVGQMFVVTHDPAFERISDTTHFINKFRGESSTRQLDSNEQNKKLVEMKLD